MHNDKEKFRVTVSIESLGSRDASKDSGGKKPLIRASDSVKRQLVASIE